MLHIFKYNLTILPNACVVYHILKYNLTILTNDCVMLHILKYNLTILPNACVMLLILKYNLTKLPNACVMLRILKRLSSIESCKIENFYWKVLLIFFYLLQIFWKFFNLIYHIYICGKIPYILSY